MVFTAVFIVTDGSVWCKFTSFLHIRGSKSHSSSSTLTPQWVVNVASVCNVCGQIDDRVEQIHSWNTVFLTGQTLMLLGEVNIITKFPWSGMKLWLTHKHKVGFFCDTNEELMISNGMLMCNLNAIYSQMSPANLTASHMIPPVLSVGHFH